MNKLVVESFVVVFYFLFQMELHPSEAEQAVFGQAEAVTKLRDQEHSLKQRVDSLQGQEERANARIRTKEQES